VILSDMVDFICGKVNQTEAEDKAACKLFLTQQHETLWHAQLWKDSLVSYTQTLSAAAADYLPSSTYLPTKGILLVPPIIERVLAVRTDSRKLNIRRPEFYYRVDYDAFAKTGAAAEYLVLPGCVWEWDSALRLYATRDNDADANAQVTADYLGSDGISVTRKAVLLQTALNNPIVNRNTNPTSTDRIDAFLKKASTGNINLRAVGTFTVTNNSAAQTIDVYLHATPDNLTVLRARLAPGQSADITAGFPLPLLSVFAAGDVFAPLSRWTFDDGVGIFSGTFTYDDDDGLQPFSETDVNVVTLASADTAGKIRQRIRLVSIPSSSSTAFTIRVLGKRVVPSFTDDLDQPAINGFVQPLLSLGQAEMLERERQYAKAGVKKQEGLALLQELVAVETVQQSHQTQIIPETGYGDDYFGGGADWGFSF
jgi:hypothetical protein